MAERYCTNCGAELAEDARFCASCGRPAVETAAISTPEADVHVPPPPQSQSAWSRFMYGSRGADEPATRYTDPTPRPSEYQQRGPGVWSGVKIGCGMFIVLPIILVILVVLFFAVVGSSA